MDGQKKVGKTTCTKLKGKNWGAVTQAQWKHAGNVWEVSTLAWGWSQITRQTNLDIFSCG